MVMKTSIKHFIMDNNNNHIVINVINKLVLLNSNIAVQGSIIMNYHVAKCIEEGANLSSINQGLLYQVFNWNHKNALSKKLLEINNGGNVENPNPLFCREKVPWSHHTHNANMMHYPTKVMTKREYGNEHTCVVHIT